MARDASRSLKISGVMKGMWKAFLSHHTVLTRLSPANEAEAEKATNILKSHENK